MAWWSKNSPKTRRDGNPAPPADPPEYLSSLPQEEWQLLRACCDEATQVVVVWTDHRKIRTGIFLGMDARSLLIELHSSPSAPFLARPMAHCCVVFFHSERTCSFVTRELMPHPERPGLLHIETPERMTMELRSFYRVPVLQDSGLMVGLSAEGKQLPPPQARDISQAGLRVAYENKEDPGIALQCELTVSLKIGELEHEVQASTRQRVVTSEFIQYGIIFHNQANGFSVPPDSQLARLVTAVERYWARFRGD